uniref:Uncharacterized protein n=1 Tax=Setaria viridis TaxID=4556 RepID=A0A4U6UST9_SETVI|nr:hypothetical protein SEVIR_4G034501v2 [Setaria viridis]
MSFVNSLRLILLISIYTFNLTGVKNKQGKPSRFFSNVVRCERAT